MLHFSLAGSSRVQAVRLPAAFTIHPSLMFICLFLFALFPSSGHRGHTPWSHFSEGRTWIPFPLHNHGKLRRLRHIHVFDSDTGTRRRRCHCSLSADCPMMLRMWWLKQKTDTCGSAPLWIILLMTMTFDLSRVVHPLWLVCVCCLPEMRKILLFFPASTDCMLFPSELQLLLLVWMINSTKLRPPNI